MSEANGIIILPEDTDGANAGETVEVYLIDSEEALCTKVDD
jgi:molybdopterin biosynthesis enzyme